MLPFAIACAASWVSAAFLISFRPKKTSAIIFFPVLVVVAAAAIFLYHLAMSQGVEGYQALGKPFQSAFGAAFIGALVMWKDGKNGEKLDEDRRVLAANHAAFVIQENQDLIQKSVVTPNPDAFPAALRAITHRPEVGREWLRVQKMGITWSLDFLTSMESEPKSDPVKVAEEIGMKLREAYPYARAAVEKAYLSLASSTEALQQEFRSVIFTLGETVDPEIVASSILASRSPVRKHEEYRPGVYRVGKIRLRITPGNTVIVFCGLDGTELLDYQTFADLETLQNAYPAQMAENIMERLSP
jgi:hypothetical protein